MADEPTTPRIVLKPVSSRERCLALAEEEDFDVEGEDGSEAEAEDSPTRPDGPSREEELSEEEHRKVAFAERKASKKLRQKQRRKEQQLKKERLEAGDLSPNPEPSARFRSLRVFAQESQDEWTDAESGGPMSPHSEPATPAHGPAQSSLADADGPRDQRATSAAAHTSSSHSRLELHKFLKTFVKVNRMVEEKDGATRGSRWDRLGDFEMRGRRNSQLFTSQSRKEKHETAEVIWLHLQAYMTGRPMRTKAQILDSANAQDIWLLRRREESKDVITDILSFSFEEEQPSSEEKASPGPGSRPSSRHASFSIAGTNIGEEDAQPPSPSKMVLEDGEEDRMSQAYLDRQRRCLTAVEGLLGRWESFCALFPSSRTMRDLLGPDLYTPGLHQRLKTLQCWYTTTRNLGRACRDVGALLGMDKTRLWPLQDYESDREEGVGAEEEEERAMTPVTTSQILVTSATSISPSTSLENLDSVPTGVYRKFVERSLRLRDMRKVLVRLDGMMGRTLAKARNALEASHVPLPDRPHSDLTKALSSIPNTPIRWSPSVGSAAASKAGLIWRGSRVGRSPDEAAKGADQPPQPDAKAAAPPLAKTRAASSSYVHILQGSNLTSRCWGEEREFGSVRGGWAEAGLTSAFPLFLHLLRVPLALVHEWLRLRVEQRTGLDPDVVTLRTLIQDSHDCLNAAVEVKGVYQSFVGSTVDEASDARLLRLSAEYLEPFETDLGRMYKIYLEYVKSWGLGLTRLEEMRSVGGSQSFLEILGREWKFAKCIAINVRSGEQDAALVFCSLSGQMLREMVSGFMERRRAEMSRQMRDGDWGEAWGGPGRSAQPAQDHPPQGPDDEERDQTVNYAICRHFRAFWGEVRERALRALDFAKLLRSDMEISAKFSRRCSQKELLERLLESRHVLVLTPHGMEEFLMFCPEPVSRNTEQLKLLLNVTCGRDDSEVPSGLAGKAGYLLLVKSERRSEKSHWTGSRVKVFPDADTDTSLHYMQVDAVYLVVVNSAGLKGELKALRRSLQERHLALEDEQCSCHEIISEKLSDLKELAGRVRGEMAEGLREMEVELLEERTEGIEAHERAAFRHALSRAYDFLFEYHKELAKLISAPSLQAFGAPMAQLAEEWSGFVRLFCEEGHGNPPSWARQGIDFLILAVSPEYSRNLTDEEFLKLKSVTVATIDYIIGGDRIKGGIVGSIFRQSSENGPASLAIQRSPRESSNGLTPSGSGQPSFSSFSSRSSRQSVSGTTITVQETGAETGRDAKGREDSEVARLRRLSGQRRRVEAVAEVDRARQTELLEARKVGRCLDGSAADPHKPYAIIEAKKLNFNWQRLEKKIGEGKFGVVHTALNLDTGQLMAVKQIDFERQDLRVMRMLVEEIRNFESIQHANLVRYFGVEVHRDQLLIFMEYCDEGTLERVCRENIDLNYARQYLNFLLRGVVHLHSLGIVHRDIKPGNIFLTSGPSVLKLGDFGSSARVQATSTLAGELTDYVGTPMYMAPEVITGRGAGTEGHGRPADVWSIGCVVLEMGTGKWPWHDAAPMQIIWKVGNGGAPSVPDALTQQCKDFLRRCFVTAPDQRSTAAQLILHDFANVRPGHLDDPQPSF